MAQGKRKERLQRDRGASATGLTTRSPVERRQCTRTPLTKAGGETKASVAPAAAAKAEALGEAPTSVSGRLGLAVSFGSALIAFSVYLRTLAPSVPTGDSGELIAAAWILGIPHPPGYPLFTMLGHLFTYLPFGSPALRVNLMSAMFHAATVGVVSLSIYRLIGFDPSDRTRQRSISWGALTASAIGGLALAFSSAFWAYAVVAEVFALNSFFCALILFILLEWERRPEHLPLLWAFGLTSGLASANHHTIVLIAPACVVLLVSGARKLLTGSAAVSMTPLQLMRHVAVAAAMFLVGLLPYVYLPLAAAGDPALNWGDPRTLQAFFQLFLRADYGTFSLTVSDQGMMGSRVEHLGILMRNLYEGFTAPASILAIAGIWWLLRLRRAAGLALALAFLLTGPGFVAFANPPVNSSLLYGVLERFYILPSTIAAVVIGVGAYQVIEWLLGITPMRQPARLLPIIGTALFAVPVGAMIMHYDRIDHSKNILDRQFGEDLLLPVEPGALLITQGDTVTNVVDYLQLVEGVRRDITMLNIEKLKKGAYVSQMRRQHPHVKIPFDSYVPGGNQLTSLVKANMESRPVYLFADTKEERLLDRFDVQRAGFARRLMPKGMGSDAFAIVKAKVELFKQMHYPVRRYPDTKFESTIVHMYGRLAFSVAYVLDDGVNNAEAAHFYRRSIELDPTDPTAYKNLGIVLFNSGAPKAEVVTLWEEYLRLDPRGDQAPEIREQLRLMNRSK
jgi:hypothetical protein